MTTPTSERQPVPHIDTARCDGCGICVRVCPTHALELRDDIAIVAHPHLCQYHGLCELSCPKQAISRPFEILVD
ncbi:MAG: 4Fe-4S binding protein [Anaerolineales bacterium]|nr:4Fe-4S binding protein [Anaerolineales bacterium]